MLYSPPFKTLLSELFANTHTHTFAFINIDICFVVVTHIQNINTIDYDGFIHLESFVTPSGISMGIKLRTEFFPIL